MPKTAVRRLTITLPDDVWDALHNAAWAAGGHGEKTRIVAEAVAQHPEVSKRLREANGK